VCSGAGRPLVTPSSGSPVDSPVTRPALCYLKEVPSVATNEQRVGNYTKGKAKVKGDGTLNLTPAQGRRVRHKGGAKQARARKGQS
jgi:hypothetical protein